MEFGILVYTILAISVFILLLASKNKEKNKRNILISIAFFLMFFVAAIRVGVGTDFYVYEEWFYKTDSIDNFMDSGFNLLILIIKLFSNNSQWLFAASSFIILLFMFKSAINEQENYELSILLFITLSFFFSSNNGIRQWISIAILMYSIKYIRERNIWKFLLFIAIASSFHMTSIVFIPFYWILNLKVENKSRVILLCLSIILGEFLLSNNRIFEIVRVVMPFYYNRYIATDSSLMTNGGGSLLPVLLSGSVFIYYLLFEKKLKCRLDYDYKMNMAGVVVVASLINTYSHIYTRIAAYFMPLIIFLIPDIFKAFDGKSKKIVYIAIIIGSLLFMLYTLYFKNSYEPLPYNTIFGCF